MDAASRVFGQMSGNEIASMRVFMMNKFIGRDIRISVWSLFWAVVAALRPKTKARGGRCMETVLVTGAAGFIGFHVARRLLSNGYDAVGVDNLNAYYDPGLKAARLRNFATSRISSSRKSMWPTAR